MSHRFDALCHDLQAEIFRAHVAVQECMRYLVSVEESRRHEIMSAAIVETPAEARETARAIAPSIAGMSAEVQQHYISGLLRTERVASRTQKLLRLLNHTVVEAIAAGLGPVDDYSVTQREINRAGLSMTTAAFYDRSEEAMQRKVLQLFPLIMETGNAAELGTDGTGRRYIEYCRPSAIVLPEAG